VNFNPAVDVVQNVAMRAAFYGSSLWIEVQGATRNNAKEAPLVACEAKRRAPGCALYITGTVGRAAAMNSKEKKIKFT
jgi:hypothetical protein